jgi:hypothetical protein
MEFTGAEDGAAVSVYDRASVLASNSTIRANGVALLMRHDSQVSFASVVGFFPSISGLC